MLGTPMLQPGRRAANSYNKEFLFHQSNSERQLLQMVDSALDRIREGSFGQCISCGAEINPKRLEAVPDRNSCSIRATANGSSCKWWIAPSTGSGRAASASASLAAQRSTLSGWRPSLGRVSASPARKRWRKAFWSTAALRESQNPCPKPECLSASANTNYN